MDAKQAAKIALNYFKELFGGYDYTDIRLEEVEKEGDSWNITLGFLDRNQEGFSLGLRSRAYKSFKVDSASGEVTSVKIRTIQ